ncbi:MAG: stage III sporulation protein AB [Ruminococcus sp.]|nr:stage III sporulation protein AB [Ruminococcus sp.]
MNYFKLFGAALVLLSCTLSGFYFSYRLGLRLRFLGEMTDFLTRLKTNIRYFSDDVFRLIKISAPSSLLSFFEKGTKPFCVYWESAAKSISKSYSLNMEDYSNLIEFGRLLGTTDTEGQISHIEIYKGIFTSAKNNFEKDCKIKSRLYKTLGFFSGAVLAIMII